MATPRDVATGLAITTLAGLLSRSASGEPPTDTGEPPTADFTWSPQSPEVGETVTLEGSVSSDPDGDIVSYEWDINGQILNGETVQFNPVDEGDITVELLVVDSGDRSDTITATITVVMPAEYRFGHGEYNDNGFGGPV